MQYIPFSATRTNGAVFRYDELVLVVAMSSCVLQASSSYSINDWNVGIVWDDLFLSKAILVELSKFEVRDEISDNPFCLVSPVI